MSSQQNVNAFVGSRKSSFTITHAVGVGAAVVGAVANFAEGGSLASSLVGGAIGGAAGYAVADVVSGSESFTGQTLSSLCAGVFGLSVGSIGSGLTTSIEKLCQGSAE